MKKILYVLLFISFIALIGIFTSFYNNANAYNGISCSIPYSYECINQIPSKLTELKVDYNNKKITVSGKMPYYNSIPTDSTPLEITLLDSTGGIVEETLFNDVIHSMQGDNSSFTKTIDFDTSNLNNGEYIIKAELGNAGSYLEQKLILVDGNVYNPSSDEEIETTVTNTVLSSPDESGACPAEPIARNPECSYTSDGRMSATGSCGYTEVCPTEMPLHNFSNSTSTPDANIDIVTNTSQESNKSPNNYMANIYDNTNPVVNLFGGNGNILRGSEYAYILFNSNNADSCTINITEKTNGAIYSNERKYTYTNIVKGKIYQRLDFGGILGNKDYGTITADISCSNLNSSSTYKDSATVNIFQDSILWKGKIKNSCDDDNNSAIDITDIKNVKFGYVITQQNVFDDKTSTTSPINQFIYGEPSINVGLDENVTPTYIPDNGVKYEYCGKSGDNLKISKSKHNNNNGQNNQNDYTTPKTAEIDLYFAPKGGGNTPSSPSSLNALGECHQNYPSSDNQAQVYISWNPAENAVSYKVYKKEYSFFGSTYKLLGQTTNTYYIDYGKLEYGKEYTYAISSVGSDGTESDKSQDIKITTPSSCTIPKEIKGTLVIDPYNSNVCINGTKQLNALYDPDGTSSRYGNFIVNDKSSWISSEEQIIQSLENGLFKGLKAGTSLIKDSYITDKNNSLTATANITADNCNNPDFSISIEPRSNTVNINSIQNTLMQTKNAYYDVDLTSLNGYSGNINLSIINVPNKVDNILNNNSLNISSNSDNKTLLTLKVHPSANTGITTFKVIGIDDNGVQKVATADINIINEPSVKPSISASIYANPIYIHQGESSILTWNSVSADFCSIDNGVGDVSLSGSKKVYPDNIGINKYVLTCKDKENNIASDYANVIVQNNNNNLSCNISANPTAIIPGESSTLSWSCLHSTINTKCRIDNNIGDVNSVGNIKVKPKKTTNYTLNCYDGEESSSDSALVKVGFLPVIREIIPR